MRRPSAHLVAWFAAYIVSIAAANWLVHHFGLISIGFGLLVPAGTFAAGAALVLRDAVQWNAGRSVVVIAILIGAGISYVTSTPAIAAASALAFFTSELVDWAVFTPLSRRNLPLAIVGGSLAAAPVDTILFLKLAGFGLTWPAVLGQFLVKTLVSVAAAAVIAYRRRVRATPVVA